MGLLIYSGDTSTGTSLLISTTILYTVVESKLLLLQKSSNILSDKKNCHLVEVSLVAVLFSLPQRNPCQLMAAVVMQPRLTDKATSSGL